MPARERTARTVAPDAVARAVSQALAATPGVIEVAIGTLPQSKIHEGPTAIEGPTGVQSVDIPATSMAYVSRDYFRVAHIVLIRGPGFSSGDAAEHEVVINQAFASRLWPGRDALGARMRFREGRSAEWVTVVGVANDVRLPGMIAELYDMQIYRAAMAAEEPVHFLVLRARGDTSALRPILGRGVERAGVGATLGQLLPAVWTLGFAFDGPRFAVVIFGAFAIIGIALTAVGLFGIIANAVARRTREIGIRLALGADSLTLTRMILGQSVRLVAMGCAIGVLVAFSVSRLLTMLVYEVNAADAVSLCVASVVIAAIGIASSTMPLRRALRVNPVDTLRAD
jgi:hypothetical protein